MSVTSVVMLCRAAGTAIVTGSKFRIIHIIIRAPSHLSEDTAAAATAAAAAAISIWSGGKRINLKIVIAGECGPHL